MSFRFRLEKVLQHRRRQVDACGRAVARAEQALRAAAALVADVRRQIQQHEQAATAAREATPAAAGLNQALAWRVYLAGVLQERERARDAARSTLTGAQDALQEAWREREVLVRLRERQHEEWRREDARRHQRELDEVGSIRAAIGAAAGPHARRGDRVTDRKRPS